MTRLKQARIALIVVAFANIALVVADWPHPSKLTTIGTLITCGGSLVLAYRESPASFHRDAHRKDGLLALLVLALLGVAVALLGCGIGQARNSASTTSPTRLFYVSRIVVEFK